MPDNTYEGISIDLWRVVAGKLDMPYEFVETDLSGLLDHLTEGKVDVGTAALTITANREKNFDFSHPFFQTGYGVVMRKHHGSEMIEFFERLFSMEFIKAIMALGVLLLLAGILIWLFERRRNTQQFDAKPIKGIGAGFWWSAVTMTTVGYGDKAPVTFWGRFVALIWMFVGIITISTFTAAITTALTETRSSNVQIESLADLNKVKVGTVKKSSSEAFLTQHLIRYQTVDSSADILSQVRKARFDAVVYDQPILHYLVERDTSDTLFVLPDYFSSQDYGFAFPEGSPLREQVNRILLEVLRGDEWLRIRSRYLGIAAITDR